MILSLIVEPTSTRGSARDDTSATIVICEGSPNVSVQV